MDIGTPQVANRRRSVVDDAADEHIAEVVDAAQPDDATPATENEDTPAVTR